MISPVQLHNRRVWWRATELWHGSRPDLPAPNRSLVQKRHRPSKPVYRFMRLILRGWPLRLAISMERWTLIRASEHLPRTRRVQWPSLITICIKPISRITSGIWIRRLFRPGWVHHWQVRHPFLPVPIQRKAVWVLRRRKRITVWWIIRLRLVRFLTSTLLIPDCSWRMVRQRWEPMLIWIIWIALVCWPAGIISSMKFISCGLRFMGRIRFVVTAIISMSTVGAVGKSFSWIVWSWTTISV